jgi:hypothetical protein
MGARNYVSSIAIQLSVYSKVQALRRLLFCSCWRASRRSELWSSDAIETQIDDTNGGIQDAAHWNTLQPFKTVFLINYYTPINALEKKLGVCHDCILGVAAEENQWGRSRGAT